MYSDGKIHDLEWFNEVYKAETVTQQNYSSEVAEGIYTYIGALQVPANATTIKFEYKDDSGNLIKSDTVPVLYSVRGPQGEQGEQGIQGIQGEQGDKGDTGNTGPQGFSYLGSFSTAPSEPNPHDFYLNTNDGYIYSYEDEEWSKVTSYSDTRYHQAVSDMIAMSNTAGLSSGFLNVINLWVENLTAQTALINQVFAKQITLQTGGSIQSSNYHEDIKHDSYFEYRIVANGQEYIGNNLKELCYEVAEDIGFEIDDDTLFRDLFDLIETIEMNVINQNVEKASFEINRDCSMCWVTLDEYIEGTVYASSYDNKSSYVSTSFYYKKINEIENLTIDTSHPYLYIQRNNPGTQPTTAKSPAYTIEDATGFKFNHDGDIKAVGGTFKNMNVYGKFVADKGIKMNNNLHNEDSVLNFYNIMKNSLYTFNEMYLCVGVINFILGGELNFMVTGVTKYSTYISLSGYLMNSQSHSELNVNSDGTMDIEEIDYTPEDGRLVINISF